MKKISILSVILLCGIISINAQDIQQIPKKPKAPIALFNLQIAQYFGLDDWNRVKFASDRLPGAFSSTDLRISANLHFIRRTAGIFGEIGVGIMPAPRDGFSDPAAQATLSSGIPFYTKETTLENGYQTASAHFKMTFGILGRIPAGEKFSVTPCFGVGFMTISAPTCKAVLKEQDTNMQYIASYQWFEQGEYNEPVIGYLAGRLRFAYHITARHYLLFGIEYTWHFTRANFSESYTNYFNHNIVTTNTYEGNRLNMLGASLGIAY